MLEWAGKERELEQPAAIPMSGATRLCWETPPCLEFVSGPGWTVIRQVLVTLC